MQNKRGLLNDFARPSRATPAAIIVLGQLIGRDKCRAQTPAERPSGDRKRTHTLLWEHLRR